MREIKFRAWDKKKKEMLYFGKPLLSYQENKVGLYDIGYAIAFYCGDFMWTHQSHIRPELILMQFTGLKDKNGKEIYEGDLIAESTINEPIWAGCGIVEERPIGEVVIRPPFINVEPQKKGKVKIVKTKNKFMKKGEYWELNLSRYDGLFEWHKDNIDIEIIGNIYENPDLIKGRK